MSQTSSTRRIKQHRIGSGSRNRKMKGTGERENGDRKQIRVACDVDDRF